MQYVHKLKEYREKHNFTQAYIADFLQITQQQYSIYEKQTREMPISLYIKIANLYNVKIDDLITPKEE